MAKETKVPKDIGPSSAFGTQSATAKGVLHFCKAPPPSKKLLVFVSGNNSREGDPPKKPPTQIKTVCTDSLRKLFCLFSAYFKGEKGDSLHKLSRNCLRKLFLFGWVVFLGGSSLHE